MYKKIICFRKKSDLFFGINNGLVLPDKETRNQQDKCHILLCSVTSVYVYYMYSLVTYTTYCFVRCICKQRKWKIMCVFQKKKIEKMLLTYYGFFSFKKSQFVTAPHTVKEVCIQCVHRTVKCDIKEKKILYQETNKFSLIHSINFAYTYTDTYSFMLYIVEVDMLYIYIHYLYIHEETLILLFKIPLFSSFFAIEQNLHNSNQCLFLINIFFLWKNVYITTYTTRCWCISYIPIYSKWNFKRRICVRKMHEKKRKKQSLFCVCVCMENASNFSACSLCVSIYNIFFPANQRK